MNTFEIQEIKPVSGQVEYSDDTEFDWPVPIDEYFVFSYNKSGEPPTNDIIFAFVLN